MPEAKRTEPEPKISATRLRTGAVFLVIWFIPFWALAPWIAKNLGESVNAGVKLGLVMSISQTIIGLVGAGIAGRDATALVKGTPFKRVPKEAWHIIRTGDIKQ